LDFDIRLATSQQTLVRAVQAAGIGKSFLRQAMSQSDLPNASTESLLKLRVRLHLNDGRGTLNGRLQKKF